MLASQIETSPPEETRFVEMIFPDLANHYGTLFGGNALSLMGKAAFVAAISGAQNLYVSLGVIACLILATATGYFGIGAAVFVHEGSTLVVLANALRLLTFGNLVRSDAP